jgi:large subunit ribosomal protein L25
MTTSLTISERTSESRATLHAADEIPAVVYGPKQESISLRVPRREFERVLKHVGESAIVELQGMSEPIEVLVQDVDFHPTKGGIQHVDFYAIERGKDMTTNVPLEFTGEAPVEKTGGMVNKILHEVTVTCRPSQLPHEITVDVSSVTDADSQILVGDLPASDGVTINHEPDEVIAVAQGARGDEPDTEGAEVDMEAVTVEEKGKAETGEEQ